MPINNSSNLHSYQIIYKIKKSEKKQKKIKKIYSFSSITINYNVLDKSNYKKK